MPPLSEERKRKLHHDMFPHKKKPPHGGFFLCQTRPVQW